MAATNKHEDRRVKRTRQVLQQAFRDVVSEKGFNATSVQDIVERANVHRGTFYLHFADKYTLLHEFVREDMRNLLSSSLPAQAGWNRPSLYLLIQTLLGYFERKYQHQRHIPQAVTPLVESAVREELTTLLLSWLERSEVQKAFLHIPSETIVRTTSWAIFGAILEWSQEETAISAKQMADDLFSLIMDGVARLAPDSLPG